MGLRALTLIAFLLPSAAFAELTSTRITPYDFQCRTATEVRVSDHARFDTAFVACLKVPGGIIAGGKYRISGNEAPPVTPPVTVNQPISWTVPPTNTDGSPLTDIASYRLYYGNTVGASMTMVTIPASQTSTVVPGLTSGTWYFQMTVVNAQGVESGRTNPASRTL